MTGIDKFLKCKRLDDLGLPNRYKVTYKFELNYKAREVIDNNQNPDEEHSESKRHHLKWLFLENSMEKVEACEAYIV